MTHVYTTLVPMPFDKLDSKHSNESKPFQVLVCIHPEDSEESWVMLSQLMENIKSTAATAIKYNIKDIKTFGIVHSYTRSTTSRWNATVIVGGFAHIANYWLTNGLIAGSTLGIEFQIDITGIIKDAQVCVVPSTATSMLTYSKKFVDLLAGGAGTMPVYIKIATYHGGTSPYLVDGFIPGPGHNILFRDPIQVVACQNSSFEVYTPKTV